VLLACTLAALVPGAARARQDALLTGTPANGAFPSVLVGSWTSNGYVSSTDFVDPATGAYAPTSGSIDKLTFAADGSFHHSNLDQSSLYSCTISLFWDAKGSATASTGTLLLTPSWSTETGRDSCNASPSHNYVKAHSLEPQTYYWRVDSYQRGVKLCLLHTAAKAKANCYWRDGSAPVQATTVQTGSGTATWSSVASGTTDDLFGVGCTAATCVAVGDYLHDTVGQPLVHDTVLDSSTDGGATWSTHVEHPTPSVYLRGAGCSGDTCVLVGYDLNHHGLLMTTAHGGARRSTPTSAGFIELHGASCVTATFCVAVGERDDGFDAYGVVLTSSDGGATWITSYRVGTRRLQAVSCASTTFCLAVGEQGALVTTTDGGASWMSRQLSTGDWLYGVSCPSASLCIAVGGLTDSTILTTTDGGAHWASYSSGFDQLLSEEGPVEAALLSCVSASGCSSGTLRAVSCTSTSFCAAVGDQGTILTTGDGGARWTSQVATGGSSTKQLLAVSCASADDCVAVGQSGVALHMG